MTEQQEIERQQNELMSSVQALRDRAKAGFKEAQRIGYAI